MADRSTRYSWILWAEWIGYFFVGAVTLALGLVALLIWAVEQWSIGLRLPVLAVLVAAVAVLSGFAIATARRRRVLALALVLVWCGLVFGILAGYGLTIPKSWLP